MQGWTFNFAGWIWSPLNYKGVVILAFICCNCEMSDIMMVKYWLRHWAAFCSCWWWESCHWPDSWSQSSQTCPAWWMIWERLELTLETNFSITHQTADSARGEESSAISPGRDRSEWYIMGQKYTMRQSSPNTAGGGSVHLPQISTGWFLKEFI